MSQPVLESLRSSLSEEDLAAAADLLAGVAPQEVAAVLRRLPDDMAAVAFRLLAKERASEVFERAGRSAQRQLIEQLGEKEVLDVFAGLDPDDRVELLDELPARVATRLQRTMPDDARPAMSVVLGYARGSVGRRMSPEFLSVEPQDSLGEALEKVRRRGDDSETIYTVPVVDADLRLVGVVSLRTLLLRPQAELVRDHMVPPMVAHADEDAETAARRCVERGVLAFPVLDREDGLVGLLTLDDAIRIVEDARDEDEARAGGAEPLRRPYLLTPVRMLARSRIVWLMVLGVSAILTVNVLELFESTLEQRVTLALFIPLLTGIGGNTGSQAATTVTRALAMGETGAGDLGRVALKEVRTGFVLGTIIGLVGWLVATAIYDLDIGLVIGLTLVGICTLSATVGGTMPLLAKAVRVDPAVFSTPFISTFCDATGLIIYFMIARAVLGL
ncbi:magnesium transporter [Aeromicrobium sp.]|uniref:magnesium transporter n=1 Tax=Aeromicrobium sp. TaxID=1871063 RepID=UPI0028AAC058|nr:magnesium transporter [Aeromicrobium sp.]